VFHLTGYSVIFSKVLYIWSLNVFLFSSGCSQVNLRVLQSERRATCPHATGRAMSLSPHLGLLSFLPLVPSTQSLYMVRQQLEQIRGPVQCRQLEAPRKSHAQWCVHLSCLQSPDYRKTGRKVEGNKNWVSHMLAFLSFCPGVFVPGLMRSDSPHPSNP
jgi:hypothetical protein